jgi:hypothetical protein
MYSSLFTSLLLLNSATFPKKMHAREQSLVASLLVLAMIKTENDIFTYYGQKRRLRDGGFLVDMGGHGGTGAHKLSS